MLLPQMKVTACDQDAAFGGAHDYSGGADLADTRCNDLLVGGEMCDQLRHGGALRSRPAARELARVPP